MRDRSFSFITLTFVGVVAGCAGFDSGRTTAGDLSPPARTLVQSRDVEVPEEVPEEALEETPDEGRLPAAYDCEEVGAGSSWSTFEDGGGGVTGCYGIAQAITESSSSAEIFWTCGSDGLCECQAGDPASRTTFRLPTGCAVDRAEMFKRCGCRTMRARDR